MWRGEGPQTILLLLGPIEKGVDHVDSGLWDLNAWVRPGQVNRVGIETNGLAVSIVMSGKSGLHVLERSSVIDGRGTVGTIAGRHGIRHQSTFWQPLKSLQPRIHQMGTSVAPLIEEGVHRDFPEPRKFGFTLANTGDRQTVVSEAIIQSVRPESVSVLLCNGNGGRCRGVVGELSLIQKLQSVGGEVEERSTETLDRCKWDTGEGVKGNEVSVNLPGRGGSDMGHSRTSESHESGEPNGHMIGVAATAPQRDCGFPSVCPDVSRTQREKERRRTYV